MLKLKFLLCLITTLVISNICHSQTLNETKNWIKDKITTLEYSGTDVNYNYSISYTPTNMIISEEITTYYNDKPSILSVVINVPIIKLAGISFSEKTHTVWLTLKTLDNSKIIKRTVNNDVEYTDKYVIILSKDVLKDNLQSRINKAFTNLIQLSGGKVIKEVF